MPLVFMEKNKNKAWGPLEEKNKNVFCQNNKTPGPLDKEIPPGASTRGNSL
jgi:hypothetical protein